MIVAFATNNHKELIKNHFGDAKMYDVYNIHKNDYDLINSINNTINENAENHNHGQKAINILNLLKRENVDILVNEAFGKNITIIVKYILPVIARINNITDVILIFMKYYDEINNVLLTNKNVFITVKGAENEQIVQTKIKCNI